MPISSIEALLVAGATETTYWRAGAGPPVLLLFEDGLADPIAAALFEHLAASARVLAPVLPESVRRARATDEHELVLSAWLRDLIDGLGLLKTTIVAGEPLAGAALAFTHSEPERVGAFIAVRRSDAGDTAITVLIVAREVRERLAALERGSGG